MVSPGTLLVTVGLRSWRFPPHTAILVGRGSDCDVVINDPRASRQHLRIEYGDGWVVHDLSARGAWIDREPLDHHRIAGRTTVRMADPADGPELLLDVEQPQRKTVLVVGRARDNDIVLNDVLVSRHHARLERAAIGWRLTDLGSRNRTLVNGRPIESDSIITDGDRFTVGGTDICLDGDNFVPIKVPRARLVADGVGYELPDSRTLLAHVELDLGPGDLVAVVGPSGAGKSTLMKVLTGELEPSGGQVTYDGYDVHRQRAAVATRIGVVPQDDVVHTRLTARRALSYAARLRFPADTSRGERDDRITATLTELGMTEHADVRIDRLSGGQRKRVSMALELLTSPSLLVLDEPTSGLDPALDRQVMSLLRVIADAGRTVVVVTHNVANLDQCDQVVLLAPGGIPVFTGGPAELHGRFGTADWAEIFTRVVAGVAADLPVRPAVRRTSRVGVEPNSLEQRGNLLRQTSTLVSRHLRLVVADRGYAIFLALVPAVLAVLALAVPGHQGLRQPTADHPSEAAQLLVLLFVGAAFMGGAAAAREVIGERAIFLRERAVGLEPVAYAMAKFVVFALICAMQAGLLVGIVGTVKPAPGDGVLLGNAMVEIGVAVWMTALASGLVSLLGSALVRSGEQVMPVLVVTVMAQLVLCGGMIPVTGRVGLSELSWLAPARWGYSAGASTVDLRAGGPAIPQDELWTHSWPWWTVSVSVLAVFGALFLALLTFRLARIRKT